MAAEGDLCSGVRGARGAAPQQRARRAAGAARCDIIRGSGLEMAFGLCVRGVCGAQVDTRWVCGQQVRRRHRQCLAPQAGAAVGVDRAARLADREPQRGGAVDIAGCFCLRGGGARRSLPGAAGACARGADISGGTRGGTSVGHLRPLPWMQMY
jgi:hypothetical protein